MKSIFDWTLNVFHCFNYYYTISQKQHFIRTLEHSQMSMKSRKVIVVADTTRRRRQSLSLWNLSARRRRRTPWGQLRCKMQMSLFWKVVRFTFGLLLSKSKNSREMWTPVFIHFLHEPLLDDGFEYYSCVSFENLLFCSEPLTEYPVSKFCVFLIFFLQ